MAHHGGDGTFRNPWPSAETRSLAQLLTGPFPLALGGASTSTDVVAPIKVVTPDWGQSLLEQKQDPAEWLRTTFLGHASSLVEVPLAGPGTRGEEAGMLRVLFDPVLESSRVGPPGPLGLGVIGPGRLLPSPCRVLDLPRVDYVAISHNHYDHLDQPTILALWARFPNVKFLVPLGNKSWFVAEGVSADAVVELDWWEAHVFTVDGPRQATVRITCVPAQHGSGRTLTDTNRSLWGGWVVQVLDSKEEIRPTSIYFAGDTGYKRDASAAESEGNPVFREIGDRFGGFDLALLPIWRGGSLGFVSWAGLRLRHETMSTAHHCNPAQAVEMHLDVKSRCSIAVHHSTFVGATVESTEAVQELRIACGERGVVPLGSAGVKGSMGAVNLGQTWLVRLSSPRME